MESRSELIPGELSRARSVVGDFPGSKPAINGLFVEGLDDVEYYGNGTQNQGNERGGDGGCDDEDVLFFHLLDLRIVGVSIAVDTRQEQGLVVDYPVQVVEKG